jgi:protein TonB
MRALLAFLLVTLSASLAPAQATSEDELRKEYVGSERMLRHFYASDDLKFDLDGTPLNTENTGPWTLLGAVMIQKLSLSSGKLVMQGARGIISIDDSRRQMKTIKWHENVRMEIATAPGPDLARLRSALAKIFVPTGPEMISFLPDYWREYMTHFFDPSAPAPCPEQKDETEPDKGKNADQSSSQPTHSEKLSVGIAEGNLIHRIAPHYLPIPRKAGIEGTVGLRGLISKTGDVVNICLEKAMGGGMEEESVNAVRQWKYSPYLLNGQPVEVETTITLTYRMH